MNYNRKIMRLELSAEKALNGGYYYAELLLPAADYEIKDAMQRTRAGGRENTVEVSILECDILPESAGHPAFGHFQFGRVELLC